MAPANHAVAPPSAQLPERPEQGYAAAPTPTTTRLLDGSLLSARGGSLVSPPTCNGPGEGEKTLLCCHVGSTVAQRSHEGFGGVGWWPPLSAGDETSMMSRRYLVSTVTTVVWLAGSSCGEPTSPGNDRGGHAGAQGACGPGQTLCSGFCVSLTDSAADCGGLWVDFSISALRIGEGSPRMESANSIAWDQPNRLAAPCPHGLSRPDPRISTATPVRVLRSPLWAIIRGNWFRRVRV
jgi:hypothetical protein